MQLFTAPPTMSLTETQFMALQATAGYTMLFKTSETQSVREIAQNTLNAIALLNESNKAEGFLNIAPHPDSISKASFLSAPSQLANNEFSIEDVAGSLNIIEPSDHFNIIKHAVQILNGTLTYQPLTASLPRGTWATTIATGTAAEITTAFRNHFWNNFTSYSSPPYFLIIATETESLGDSRDSRNVQDFYTSRCFNRNTATPAEIPTRYLCQRRRCTYRERTFFPT